MSTTPNTSVRQLNWEQPTNLNGLKAFTGPVVAQMNKALPKFLAGQGDRLVRCLFTVVQANPKLMDCMPMSLFGGVIMAGQLGLEIGGPLGQSYLIPYGKQATFVLGYRGALSLAHRSSQLRSIRPVRVLEGDHFEVRQGTDAKIIHLPKRGNKSTRVTDYYVTSDLVNGGTDFETFSYEEAVEFRDRYSSSRTAPEGVKKKMPWYDESETLGWNGFDTMAAKTMLKRLCKRLPVSVEFQAAIGLDDTADAGEDQNLGAFVNRGGDDGPEPPPEDALKQRLEAAKNAGAGPRDDDPPEN